MSVDMPEFADLNHLFTVGMSGDGPGGFPDWWNNSNGGYRMQTVYPVGNDHLVAITSHWGLRVGLDYHLIKISTGEIVDRYYDNDDEHIILEEPSSVNVDEIPPTRANLHAVFDDFTVVGHSGGEAPEFTTAVTVISVDNDTLVLNTIKMWDETDGEGNTADVTGDTNYYRGYRWDGSYFNRNYPGDFWPRAHNAPYGVLKLDDSHIRFWFASYADLSPDTDTEEGLHFHISTVEVTATTAVETNMITVRSPLWGQQHDVSYHNENLVGDQTIRFLARVKAEGDGNWDEWTYHVVELDTADGATRLFENVAHAPEHLHSNGYDFYLGATDGAFYTMEDGRADGGAKFIKFDADTYEKTHETDWSEYPFEDGTRLIRGSVMNTQFMLWPRFIAIANGKKRTEPFPGVRYYWALEFEDTGSEVSLISAQGLPTAPLGDVSEQDEPSTDEGSSAWVNGKHLVIGWKGWRKEGEWNEQELWFAVYELSDVEERIHGRERSSRLSFSLA